MVHECKKHTHFIIKMLILIHFKTRCCKFFTYPESDLRTWKATSILTGIYNIIEQANNLIQDGQSFNFETQSPCPSLKLVSMSEVYNMRASFNLKPLIGWHRSQIRIRPMVRQYFQTGFRIVTAFLKYLKVHLPGKITSGNPIFLTMVVLGWTRCGKSSRIWNKKGCLLIGN